MKSFQSRFVVHSNITEVVNLLTGKHLNLWRYVKAGCFGHQWMLATRRGVSAGDVSFASAAERHDKIMRLWW